MHNVYIFDVDGTLTPSRDKIDPKFHDWFLDFASENEIILVTGSDRPKTLNQLGPKIMDAAATVYQCSGNDIWEKGENILSNSISVSPQLRLVLDHYRKTSPFVRRVFHANHIDVRPGLINFSVVGHGCTKDQRASYINFDTVMKERERIAATINKREMGYVATVAGETGIDITLPGGGKEQIIQYIAAHNLHFFGDKMQPGGNDYGLALEMINSGNSCYPVKDWNDTWNILKTLA